MAYGTFSVSSKYAFIEPTEEHLEQLEKYVYKRLEDGQGECFLELGTGDGQSPGLSQIELEQSIATLEQLASKLTVNLIHLRDRRVVGAASINNARPHTKSIDDETSLITTSASSPSSSTNSTSTPQQTTKSGGGKQKIKSVSSSDSPLGGSPSILSHQFPEPTSKDLAIKEYLLRKEIASDDFVDVRVAVVGNVDAGKSTLLGVLTHGELDNGRGQARLRLLRHKHEAESGRTSSVSNDILGFNAGGEVVNKPVHGQLDWTVICKASSKVVTFIDLAGHERYLKTTIFGMTGHAPDYAMFMVGANAGVIGMAKEHLGLALALGVPVFVVVTKVDMCPANVLQETMSLLCRILKSPGCRKIPLLISSRDDVICSATNFTSERMCPIFSVSNVTGENLDLLKQFLNLITPRAQPRLTEPAHFQVDDIFAVPGVGNVVAGTCLSGIIRLNDTLLLGPSPTGQFLPVPIKSIHRKRMPVSYVRGGQAASFSLRKIRRNQLRKGIVLIAPELKPTACMEFIAEVLILHHPTTIWVGYQAMVHAGPVRQTATILALSGHDRLRTGDKDLVRFRFIKYPEYLYAGLRLIFREGKTKAVGTVKETFPLADPIVQNPRNRTMKKIQSSQKPDSTTSPTTLTIEPTPSQSQAPDTDRALDPFKPAYSKQRKHFKSSKAARKYAAAAPSHTTISQEIQEPSHPNNDS